MEWKRLPVKYGLDLKRFVHEEMVRSPSKQHGENKFVINYENLTKMEVSQLHSGKVWSFCKRH